MKVDNSQELRQGFESRAEELGLYTHGFQRYTQVTADNENALRGDQPKVEVGDYCSPFMQDAWKIYQAFHISLVTKPEPVKSVTRYDGGMSLGGQLVVKATDFDQERALRLAAEAELEALKASYQTVHEVLTTARRARDRATMEVGNLQADLQDAKRHANILEISVKNFDRMISLQGTQLAISKKALGDATMEIQDYIANASLSAPTFRRLKQITADCFDAIGKLTLAPDTAESEAS